MDMAKKFKQALNKILTFALIAFETIVIVGVVVLCVISIAKSM
jgi:hypothetical protein